ncbi:MAG: DUF6782 family putative metallopeptidase [Alphaproteobacteria bacterium]
MSDTFEKFCNKHMIENRVCGVAYTLDDSQPVICTHIGDQPLFYLDEEIIDEEEDYLNIEELAEIAKEIQTLKHEITGMDDAGIYLAEKTMALFNEFSDNMNDISTMADLYEIHGNETPQERISAIKELLEESRLAAAYLNVADKHNVQIIISEQIETAFYDRRSGTILLYPYMDLADQVLLVARELRRHWQHRQGVLLNPLAFSPEHAILVNRAQDADLIASVIRIAWELQLAGKRDVWQRVENSPMADLARAFAREAFIDFRTLNNGEACTSLFEAWFLSERCRQKDKVIIQSMLADQNSYTLGDEKSSYNVTVELIAALGEMPFGKNYLSKYAQIIIDDPIFMEVRDRSSANFLWFIKFERSFKQAEQELQYDSDLSTHDIRHGLCNSESQDSKNDPQLFSSADIIQLYEHAPTREYNKKSIKGKKNDESANGKVIEMRQWSRSEF